VAEAHRITIGDGLKDGTQTGPLVSEGQFRKVLAAINHA